MKAGTKVSWRVASGTHATRQHGVFLGSAGEGYSLVGEDNPNGVHPVRAVANDRIAEVLDKEDQETHAVRLRQEEAAKAVANAKKARAKAERAEK